MRNEQPGLRHPPVVPCRVSGRTVPVDPVICADEVSARRQSEEMMWRSSRAGQEKAIRRAGGVGALVERNSTNGQQKVTTMHQPANMGFLPSNVAE